MVFKATNISRGTGRALVTATGKNSEIGKIATSMSEMKTQDSNFNNKTAKLGKQMAAIAVATAAIVFAIGFLIREFEFEEILLVTIATLVFIHSRRTTSGYLYRSGDWCQTDGKSKSDHPGIYRHRDDGFRIDYSNG